MAGAENIFSNWVGTASDTRLLEIAKNAVRQMGSELKDNVDYQRVGAVLSCLRRVRDVYGPQEMES